MAGQMSPNTVRNSSRVAVAELTSGTGALVLGVGIGSLFASSLARWTVPVLIVGAFLHAWGMFDKHRVESGAASVQPWWTTALYWICWLGLAALAVVVVRRG